MIVSRFSFELQLPQTQTSQHPQLRVRVSMASHRCSKKRERARTAINTQTWELINLPEARKAIRCKWRWTQRERHLHAAARGVSSNPDIRETSARWRMCRTDWNRSAESESRNVTERCSGLHCVYCRFENGTFLIVAVYVDHLLMFWNTLCWVNQLKKQLAGKFLMKDLELTNKVLGIRVTTRQKNNACLDQEHCGQQLLKRFGMEDCFRNGFGITQEVSIGRMSLELHLNSFRLAIS